MLNANYLLLSLESLRLDFFVKQGKYWFQNAPNQWARIVLVFLI